MTAAAEDDGQPAAAEPDVDAVEQERPGETDQERDLRREAIRHRRELRAAQGTNDELRNELERLRVAHESEQDRAIREAVQTAEQRLTSEFATERLHNRLRVRAAGRLRDAEDAVLHLGGILPADAEDQAVDDAIEQLIKERDYLANPAIITPITEGNSLVTQGARSQPPGRALRETSPDDWIRSRARRRQ